MARKPRYRSVRGGYCPVGPNAIDAHSPRCLPTRGDWDALPRTSKWAGRGTTEKTELRRLLDRTSQLFRRPADVGGLLIPVLWFGMDFKGAASKEVAALQARQQYLTTLAVERCGKPRR